MLVVVGLGVSGWVFVCMEGYLVFNNTFNNTVKSRWFIVHEASQPASQVSKSDRQADEQAGRWAGRGSTGISRPYSTIVMEWIQPIIHWTPTTALN